MLKCIKEMIGSINTICIVTIIMYIIAMFSLFRFDNRTKKGAYLKLGKSTKTEKNEVKVGKIIFNIQSTFIGNKTLQEKILNLIRKKIQR